MPLPVTLTASGQPAQALAAPTSWADVTLAQYLALFAPAEGERRTVAEVLLGLDAGGLNQLAADDVVLIVTLLEFASDPSPVTDLLPPPGLPDVGSLPWGCLVLCQEYFTVNEGRPLLASLPYVLAVYRCQLTHGNTNRLDEVLAQVLAEPVLAVYAEALAFTTACQQSLSGTRRTPTATTVPPMKKLKLAAKSWWRNLGQRFKLMLWLKAT